MPDVLNCVNNIDGIEFTIKDVYGYEDILQQRHKSKNNVRAKIRQQLQLLRDKGFIEFVDRGYYRKII